MDSATKTTTLRIGGMSCASCQERIEKALNNTAGIEKAVVNHRKGIAVISYWPEMVGLTDFASILEGMGYELRTDKRTAGRLHTTGWLPAAGLMVLLLAGFQLLKYFGLTEVFNVFPTAEAGMSYGMLLFIGLCSSVHCVAMCGGINLSQCVPHVEGKGTESRLAALGPGLLYNLGRVVSYTVVGGIVGALGSVISFSGRLRGIVLLATGAAMVVMGVNMLGVFPWLARFTPRLPRAFSRRVGAAQGRGKRPFYVGLLAGLMPCGPLQAMQLYALSTGSPYSGAASMLAFSLGTAPLMLGLSALGALFTKKRSRTLMQVSAALVAVFGLSMFSQGWSLSGFRVLTGAPVSSAASPALSSNAQDPAMEGDAQIIQSTLRPGRYPTITVQVGVPVAWTINAPTGSINGCNNRMLLPEYGIEYQFKTGENRIEFTPSRTGVFPYSCWMGMIRGSITVVEAESAPAERVPVPAS